MRFLISLAEKGSRQVIYIFLFCLRQLGFDFAMSRAAFLPRSKNPDKLLPPPNSAPAKMLIEARFAELFFTPSLKTAVVAKMSCLGVRTRNFFVR
ncbi:hypothetical protein Cflav_PD3659 [Pedosphaera parvula Ellin514]|uniref:Uncharacterized protein n=1 Tax=Pedosphaera parvula (strain Ellin514) TaxID=320771 RepID=B9XHG6_PEDPL|nr:hypothetical protein Cflav_PD3659 [Pedosphaera parvula Ellin514]